MKRLPLKVDSTCRQREVEETWRVAGGKFVVDYKFYFYLVVEIIFQYGVLASAYEVPALSGSTASQQQ
ncbi:hypothetical protein PSEUDO8Z_100071 [Pseudomonas sp. 8Z]|nr:hypothetical protein PSEUDO8Z_100071 [Pseudomonas sp. 8Z]